MDALKNRGSVSLRENEKVQIMSVLFEPYIRLTSFAQISASPKLRICWKTLGEIPNPE